MAQLGQWNYLAFLKETSKGYLLDGKSLGEILLPKKYCNGLDTSQEVFVFIYSGSENTLLATTQAPIATAGEFGFLECVDKTSNGYFFELGIEKHLFVPFAQMDTSMKVGSSYVVRVFVDEKSMRLAGSTKLNNWLSDSSNDYFEDQEVDLIIAKETDIGFKAIINHSNWGLLYKNQVFQDLPIGKKIKGYIHETRPDGKIDLKLDSPVEERVPSLSAEILLTLKDGNGVIHISDKSSPEEIRDSFKTSKKTFKKALGHLYKNKLIEISPTSIRLISQND